MSDDPPPADDAPESQDAMSDDDHVELGSSGLIAERVLSEPEPLPFRTRFPIGTSIGKGGMAEVFMARDLALHRVVAVKVLHGDRSEPARLQRFLREAQVTAQLSHPNVVPVHAIENMGDGRPAIVMKCVEGDTFKALIASCRTARGTPAYRSERHGVPARLEAFLRVCDAIAYAHARGVVHRDLKPANLMLGAFGEVYVMDWGIARLRGDVAEAVGDAGQAAPVTDSSGLLTRGGGFVGTPAYMAPEQAKSGDVGPAADQFALGMVLFELVTLRRPRVSDDFDEIIGMAMDGRRAEFGDEPAVAPELRAIVDRATRPDPAERYASVSDFAADVRRFLHGQELRAYPDNFVRKVWRVAQRHPVAVLASLLVVVLLAAASTTLSLLHAIDTERVASERARTLTALVSRISDFVHEMDQRAVKLEVLVESLGVEIESALRTDEQPEVRLLRPSDLNGPARPADARTLPRYGGPTVSFLEPVAVLAPTANRQRAASQEARMGGVREMFPRLWARTERAEDAREKAGPQYAYVGFDSGLLINYPGLSVFPADYDPRNRPWYRPALARPDAAWGDPYPDASGSGYLVPCNRAIRDAAGELVGVVGVDATLDLILEILTVPGLDHQRDTWLVDRQGRVVASSDDRGRAVGVGIHGDRTKQRRPLGMPGLERVLEKDPANGAYERNGELYVFARLRALDWYVVVVLDGEAVLD